MIRLTGLVNLRAIGSAPVGSWSVNEEELSGKQSKLDVDKDGKIEGEDLEKLRNQKNESLDEEEYDSQRDDRISRSMFGSNDDDDDYGRNGRMELPDRNRPSRFPKRSSSRRPQTPSPAQRPVAPVAAQQSTQARNTLLQQKVKYTDAAGKSHEATVKSLLGYPKEHPGRKVAARMYAQHMAKMGNKAAQEVLAPKGLNEENMDDANMDAGAVDDHEGQMAKADLLAIHKYSKEIYNMLGDNEELEGWVQSKLTKAAEYLNSVYNNMNYEKNKPGTLGDGEGSPADNVPATNMNESASINSRKKIDTPFALAHYMKKQGYTSRKGK